jgi:hypothetical protein
MVEAMHFYGNVFAELRQPFGITFNEKAFLQRRK